DDRGFAHIRDLMMPLVDGGPQQGRQVLRKLGVSRIMVTSDGAGWRFEGDVDFSSLLGTPEAQPPPSHPPWESVARAKPALEGWLVRRATGARREVHKVGRHNHARWLLGAVLALAATLAVPRDGQTQMGGTPAQGAQRQSQGAGAAPPFDLKDEAVVKQ